MRNERLSVRLQQRPEADDVRALQQQLSSLHLLMEQASSQHHSDTMKLQAELDAKQAEGEGLRRELEAAKEEREGRPKTEDMSKSVLLYVHTTYIRMYIDCQYVRTYHNSRKLQKKKILEAEWLPKIKYPSIINMNWMMSSLPKLNFIDNF